MFEAGALVLLPFPYSDASASKRRPVLALTRPDEFSSRSHHANAIPLQNDSLTEGQLPKPSWIRTDRAVTLNAGLVIKAFAKTRAEVQRQAVGCLCEALRQQIPSA